MKNLILIAFVILTSVCFGQTEMKIYKKNGQVESVPITQVDSVKYSTSSPILMNVYKNNNTAILSVSINDIDSIKYLTNGISVGSIGGLNCANATNNGALTTNTVASGVNSVISYTGGNAGTYTSQTISSTGVLGLTASLVAGTFANGNGILTFTITGTPTTSGTASFEINIGEKTCVFTRSVELPLGSISALDCGNAINNGVLTANTDASDVSSVISYSGGNGGTFKSQTISSTGVLGLTATLAAGTFANGNGTLTYEISGTSTSNGTASFELIIGGKTCTLTRDIDLPVGLIATLECGSAINNGTLTENVIASGVNSEISYTGANGGTYMSQTISSTGVLGLTATLVAGTFANGNGILTYEISGTPTSNGSASFELIIGGITCTLSREVIVPEGKIVTLACDNPIQEGDLTTYTLASGVSSIISYTGGNGGAYLDQTISSTGVEGLIATLAAGTFANGNGTLTFTITGTPTTSGTAIFEINIGGKTCTLSREVNLPEGKIVDLDCGNEINSRSITKTNEVYFNIESPISLKGNYTIGVGDSVTIKKYCKSTWGNGDISGKTLLNELKLVKSIDSLAGTNLSEDFTGKIALVYRGTYGYALKALNAQKAGANAVIIMNHGIQADGSVKSTEVFPMNGQLTGESEENATGLQVNIPVILISKQDRDKILAEIKNGAIITANLGGKIQKSINSVIYYTGGNGGSYIGQTLKSSGVTGLTATLHAGNLDTGDGNLTYVISGTPNKTGTANFTINFGDKSCVLSHTVIDTQFTSTESSIGTFENDLFDIEGNKYKTVKIGKQIWMAENLKVSKYRDGSDISNITDNNQWNTLSGAWSYFQNNCYFNSWGKLYNWYAVSSSDVCPAGWHVPNDTEWSVMIDYLGGSSIAGGKMKEVGSTSSNIAPLTGPSWYLPNTGATNSSLFSGRTTGVRDYSGNFSSFLYNGSWWSATENTSVTTMVASYVNLNNEGANVSIFSNDKRSGYAVRCIQDPISSLECNSAKHNGELNAYTVTNLVSSEIVYTGGYGSSHNGQTVLSTGVTGLTATLTSGVFEDGTGSLKYVISGTPVSQGKADFAINIGGKTCTLSRNVVLPVGHIDSLNCKTAINKGTLTVSSAANNVNSVLYYFGGNGGSLKEININSTGVNGLSARLTADTLKIGYGEFKVEILGKPTSIGIANFLIEIGGESCNLSRIILPIGLVDTLDCNKISSNGILMANYEAVNVSNTLNYTGGNGGSYNSQYINSKGVLGLVATLNEDVFSKGKGVLTYSITGVPDSIGTAVFEINIGGKTCSIMRFVGGQGENIIDIDGNNYKTVYIGTQRWMAENLTVSKFNDGTDIAIGHDIYKQWSSLTNGAWCYYDYYFNKNEINDAKYGKLYNWYAVSSTTNGNKNLCPTGWHVPSVTEFILLKDYLGGESVAGGKMKEVGTTSWIKSNSDASNISLFTGLPGGFRAENGYFEGIGSIGFWWLSNPVSNPVNDAMFFSLNDDAYVLVLTYSRARGFSVRCLED